MRGVAWLKEQLAGSEMLEERGRMILAGRVEQYAKGDKKSGLTPRVKHSMC